MGETLDTATTAAGRGGDAALDARFDALKASILHFRPREPHEHPDLYGGELSIPFERILAGLARGREAIDLAIGEGLCLLEDRDQLMDLGYSRMTDYAREELGLPPSTAREKSRLVRELRTRPLLREAVASGRLSPRHARELYPVASGDAEGAWVGLAATMTVRELHEAVRRALARSAGDGGTESEAARRGVVSPGGGARASGEAWSAAACDDARWRQLCLAVPPEYRPVVDEAMRLAEQTLWPGAPVWKLLEAMADEFLGWYGDPKPEEAPAPAESLIPPGELEKALEFESNAWDWLEPVEPLAAPQMSELGAQALDARLKELVEQRRHWDEAFGVAARGFAKKRMATWLGFANLGHYLKERLGMSRRGFEQRVWLEKRMEALPQLRHALERGEVSYEKARLVAGVADFDSVNRWIRRAAGMTCVELERAISGVEDAQACARGKLEARMPEEVAGEMDRALRRADEVFGPRLTPGMSLVLVAVHFVRTWGPLLRGRSPPSRIRRRDGGYCTCPGCSRAAGQDHHVLLRSQGGSNDPGNLTALCAPHHLRGIHGGRLRVSGTAPDRLVWELNDGRPFTAGRRAPGRPAVGPRW